MLVSSVSSCDPRRCVVLVPVVDQIDLDCENALRDLERKGYEVRRTRGFDSLDQARSQMASEALRAGFEELMWIDSQMAFRSEDVERLRSHPFPIVAAIAPQPGVRKLACAFLPGTQRVELGRKGSLLEIRYVKFGFVLTRRTVFETIQERLRFPICNQQFGERVIPWFLPMVHEDEQGPWYLPEDYSFCQRARQCGIPILADTTIRVAHFGKYPYTWENSGSDPQPLEELTLLLPSRIPLPPNPTPESEPAKMTVPTVAATPVFYRPVRNPLHTEPTRLREGFPRIHAYLFSYSANRESLEQTREDFRLSDWGQEPEVFLQPEEWPCGKESASRNYRRILEKALQDNCDFALILEDDVRVNRFLHDNLVRIPLVARDQCDYLSLFMPDLVAAPWEREERHLGYRLARSLYSGPNQLWERSRVWGSQGYLLSRRFLKAALPRWDQLQEGQDTRVISVCSELGLPLWYTCPCLVEHAPLQSAFGTPAAHAPDFDVDFRLETQAGFQPPEEVPGWLTFAEGELLWRAAQGKRVLELGTALGRSTVCLGQSAAHLTSIDQFDQSEAREWVRRFGLESRTTLLQGDVQKLLGPSSAKFDLIFIDTEHDAASVQRDIGLALPLLELGGQLAFHDYPDPGWPEVRQVVDAHAAKFHWKRLRQAHYLGLFRTG